MRWAMSSLGLISIGLFGILIIVLFQSVTVSNEQDYYLLKEVAEASMIDSIDLAYYRDTGEVKMIQEKFVENFTRRYSEVVNIHNSTGMSLEFYDIIEKPPKVSILIRNNLGTYRFYSDSSEYNIVNKLDAILEADDSKLPKSFDNKCKFITQRYYSILEPTWVSGAIEAQSGWQQVNLYEKVDGDYVAASGYKIDSIEFMRRILSKDDYENGYKGTYEQMYGRTYSGSTNFNTNNFAKNLDVKELKINSENNTFFWKGKFSCEKADENTGKCAAGIVFDIVWKQYENCGVEEENENE